MQGTLKTLFLLFFFLCSTPSLFAQFQGYETVSPSTYSAGLSASGVAVSREMGSLLGNPAFLSEKNRNVFQLGFQSAVSARESGHMLYSGGAYISRGQGSGYGIQMLPLYNRYFSKEESFFSYALPLFYSMQISKQIGLAFSFGPSLVYRPFSYSTSSIHAGVYLSYEYGKMKWGAKLISPGSFRMDDYLITEKLRERLPEKFSWGATYQVSANLFLLIEIHRVFWERARFDRNDRNELGNLEQGWGRTVFGNLGLGRDFYSLFQVTAGVSNEGFVVPSGTFVRVVSGSLGVSGELYPSLLGRGIFLSSFVQRTGTLGDTAPLGNEMRFGFQITYAPPENKEID